MKKKNGKIIVEPFLRKIPEDYDERLEYYLAELKAFHHNDAVDFIRNYVDRMALDCYMSH